MSESIQIQKVKIQSSNYDYVDRSQCIIQIRNASKFELRKLYLSF